MLGADHLVAAQHPGASGNNHPGPAHKWSQWQQHSQGNKRRDRHPGFLQERRPQALDCRSASKPMSWRCSFPEREVAILYYDCLV